MSKPSHIPLFPDAYLRDNFRMTLEQHGMFFMLMMEAWNREDCTLPDNDKALAEICGVTVARFRKISPQVLEKWTRDGGRIYQKRLVKEYKYVLEKSKKRKAAANERWSKAGDANECKSNANAMHLGGGEGEGGGVLASKRDSFSNDDVSHKVDGPFSVLNGGKS